MGGPATQRKLKHASVVRHIIDYGWTSPEEDDVYLAAPFHEIRDRIFASGAETRADRVEAYVDYIAERADGDFIVQFINQADLTSEPPTPDPLDFQTSQPSRPAHSGPPPKPDSAPIAEPLSSLQMDKLAHLSKPSERREITLLPAWESDQPPQARKWVITDLISQASLNIVFGKEGSKKTYAMLDLAVCTAMGKPWLDFETDQTAVLWVDEESGQERWWARRHEVMSAHKAAKTLPLKSAVLQRFNLRLPGEAYLLGEQIMGTRAGLVVIDALMDVVPGADENAVRDMVPVFRDLRMLCEASGAAIIVIHHTNKVGGIRGSSAIPGQVDLTLKVESPPNTTHIEFASGKTRDIEMTRFAARIHFEPEGPTPERVWLEAAESKAGASASNGGISKAGKYVLGYLREHGESTTKEMKDGAEDVSPNVVRQSVYKLVEMGLIERVDGGGSGKTAVFDLTKEAEEYA